MTQPQIRVVVGANWGDEGKGRMVDYFAEQADVVCRFQGGNNAGHTVINEFGEFKLHLLPSGVFDKATVNVLGSGMVIDVDGLGHEIDDLAERGIYPQLLISDRATLALPLNRMEDVLEERRLGDNAFGSTRNGIAYAYADRSAKKALQVGMLKDRTVLKQALTRWYDWKVPMLTGLYGEQDWPSLSELYNSLCCAADRFAPLITDLHSWQRSQPANQRMLFEAQLGSLRDLQQGNYPFTTSSSVLASGAELFSGLSFTSRPHVTAVVKAFSSSVGRGPFPCAMDDMTDLRESALEYGARTGRPRDIGHFDAVATRYGVDVQKADEIALTKLDCLSGLAELKICVGYELDGKRLTHYPMTEELFRVTPIYETVPGWDEPISEVRQFGELPVAAQRYVDRVEALIGGPIPYISVGPRREQLIVV